MLRHIGRRTRRRAGLLRRRARARPRRRGGFGSCSEEEVIDRHTAWAYRVFIVGFVPGFAYLAAVDERIAAPRRATPRVRCPGRIGSHRGPARRRVYPAVTPGGWNIIGRTPVKPFDADRARPRSCSQPGIASRFDRITRDEFERSHERRSGSTGAVPWRSLTVFAAGHADDVQDLGRWGHAGARVCRWPGRWTRTRIALANRLVGNAENAAALEITLIGPELAVRRGTLICAVAGATFALAVGDGSRCRCTRAVRRAGWRAAAVRCAQLRARAATLAVAWRLRSSERICGSRPRV